MKLDKNIIITGLSACGKTTLVKKLYNLLKRNYKVLFIDGINYQYNNEYFNDYDYIIIDDIHFVQNIILKAIYDSNVIVISTSHSIRLLRSIIWISNVYDLYDIYIKHNYGTNIFELRYKGDDITIDVNNVYLNHISKIRSYKINKLL